MGMTLFGTGWGTAQTTRTNTAAVSLYCMSVRFEPGVYSILGIDYVCELFSGFNPDYPNGELYSRLADSGPTHVTSAVLTGPDLPMVGDLALDVPEQIDGDADGIPDFYEVERAIPGGTVTQGLFFTEGETGTVSATWERSAGSRLGQCVLAFTFPSVSPDPVFRFTHQIEVQQYDGLLRYVPSDGPVQGVVDLAQVDRAAGGLRGPIALLRSPTNSNLLEFGESTWTDSGGRAVPVTGGIVEPDSSYAMDYFGAMALTDGDLDTPEVDYEIFLMGIRDPNDVDRDGIPDLSDQGGVEPERPRLRVAWSGGGVELTLSGPVGAAYELQGLVVVPSTNWQTIDTITLTSSNHVVHLAPPSAATAFWRLRSP